MALEDLPPTVQAEVMRLVETLRDTGIVEATMRLRALQELNEGLGSDALMRLVATLIGGL